MTSGYKVSDVMNKTVYGISPEDNIQDAAKKMRDNKAGSVVVLDDDNPIGILTDTDIVNKVVASNMDPTEIKVGDAMSSPIVVGNPEEDITEIGERMSKNGIKRIPIIENSKAVGMITTRDLTKVYPQIIDILSEKTGLEQDKTLQIEAESTTGMCEMCESFTTELERDVEGNWTCPECKMEE